MYGRERLAASLAAPGITVAPGVYDGISARLVEQQGFETGFLSGAGVSNSRLAQPDVGFLSLPDVADLTRHLADAVDIPIWVDADTGYGNAVGVHRTVRRLADAGAAAVMIEDQEWPKRCGHMAGKSVIPFAEAVAKELGTELVSADAKTFANGEIYARYGDSVRGSDVFVIQSHSDPINEWVMEQLIMVDALKRASARRITVVAPFYPYARQDKKGRGREPISARLMADLFKAAGADRIMSVDLHAAQIQGFFDGPVDHPIEVVAPSG